MVENNILVCRFCRKNFKNRKALAQHELRCIENPERRCFNNFRSAWERPWNKGLTCETDERVRKATENSIKNRTKGPNPACSHPHSQEFKDRQRKRALEEHWESHFGSHKSYLYKGVKFVSSYEVELAKDLDLNHVLWEKPKRFSYKDNNGRDHHYTADFYLPEYDIYLDPKNDYLIENINPILGYSDLQKILWVQQQNNVKVIVLDKDHLSWDSVKSYLEGWDNR